MSLFESPENLKLLRNLLNPPETQEENSDLEEEVEGTGIKPNLTPGSIGPTKSCNTSTKSTFASSPYALLDDAKESSSNKTPSTIEEWQQLQEKEDLDILESRKCPEYSMAYRQAVCTEDIYLQMGNRTNASASCEDLVLDIMLPGETTPVDKMNLSITACEVDLATPLYRLKLPLTHRVNVDRCRAKYDKDLEKLTLTLRLQRELDFVNF